MGERFFSKLTGERDLHAGGGGRVYLGAVRMWHTLNMRMRHMKDSQGQISALAFG